MEALGILKTGYKADEVVPRDLTENKQENLIQLDAFVRKEASLPIRQEKRDLSEVVDKAFLERLRKQSKEADDAAKDAVRKRKKNETNDPAAKKEAAKKKKEADELAKAELRRQRLRRRRLRRLKLRRQRLRRLRLRRLRHRQMRRNSRSNEKKLFRHESMRHCLHHHLQRKIRRCARLHPQNQSGFSMKV